ncbi:MAG TPA: hypothetical protein VJI70_02110 [Candidatus Paceibacterota bacterium]
MLYIDLKKVMRNPLMREARRYFLMGISLGIIMLFFADDSNGREFLLHGFIVLVIIAVGIVTYLAISNSRLRT